jgi:DNA-binding transcriptional regulator YhcF (GntR family)
MLIGHPCSSKELAEFTRTNINSVLRYLKELVEDGSVGKGMSVADSMVTLYYLKKVKDEHTNAM